MRERKLRAILTIAMVMTGAGLMVALNGLTTGVYNYIEVRFGTLGANVVYVWENEQHPTNKTVSAIGRLADVKTTIPLLARTATFEAAGGSGEILVAGEDQKYLKEIYPSLQIVDGTLMASNDLTGVVLGHSIAYLSNAKTPDLRVGSNVTISYAVSEEQIVSRSFIVRGILAKMGGYDSLDDMALISLPAATSLFATPAGEYDGLNVIATTPEKAEAIAETIRRTYEAAFEVDTLKSMIDVVHGVTNAFSVMTTAIASVSLIVASVGIFAGLYTSVTERTKEIGLLKAIGFKKRGILGVFLGEATLIGIIGGLLGDIVGVGLAHAMAYLAGTFATEVTGGETAISYVPPTFTPENFLFVFGFSVAVSMLAGAYPAWRASRLDPVVALRKE
jgi:putative ABC transport system permease protein